MIHKRSYTGRSFFSLFSFVAAVGVVLLLSGCLTKSYEILSTEFPQVKKHEPSYETIKEYLRSITLYEGFETKAQFDVLWMSDDIRSLYAALHSAKVGHNDQEKDAFLLRQLEENSHWVTFYVLAQVNDEAHISLTDPNSSWSLFLKTNQVSRLAPVSVKEVELEPELRFLFGHRFALFKKVYKVQFAANDLTGASHLQPHDRFWMISAGAGMSGTMSWKVPLIQKQSVLRKKNTLQYRKQGGLFAAFAEFAAPKQRDEDFFW